MNRFLPRPRRVPRVVGQGRATGTPYPSPVATLGLATTWIYYYYYPVLGSWTRTGLPPLPLSRPRAGRLLGGNAWYYGGALATDTPGPSTGPQARSRILSGGDRNTCIPVLLQWSPGLEPVDRFYIELLGDRSGPCHRA